MLSVGIGGTGIAGGGLLNRVIAAIRRNQGVLYWPADNLSGMWTDSTGLSPVTVVGDVLGLMADRTQPTIARRNLLTWTQAFDNAAWSKSNSTVTANVITAPDGTLTADKLVENSATNYHFVISSSVTPVSSTGYTLTAHLKAAERNFACVQVALGGVASLFCINLTTGATTAPTGGGTVTVSAPVDGWYRVSFVFTTVSAAAGTVRFYTSNALSNDPNYLGDGASGVFVWGAQLETGSTATAYQRIDAGQGEWLSGNYSISTAAWQATTASKPLITRVPKRVGTELVTNGSNETALFTFGTALSSDTLARAAAPGGGFAASATSTTSSSAEHRFLDSSFSLTAGKAYRITGRFYVPTGGVATFRLYDAGDGSWSGLTSTTKDQWVPFSVVRTAKGSNWALGFGDNAPGVVTSGQIAYWIDDLSVSEVLEYSNAMSFDGSNDSLTCGLASGGSPFVRSYTTTGTVSGFTSATTTTFVMGQPTLANRNVCMIVGAPNTIPAADLLVIERFAQSVGATL